MQISVPTMQDLLSAGVHFGHKSSRSHPKMRPFIYGARDGVDIIDLAKSEEKLKEATQAAYELGKAGKVMLMVGTKKQAREIVETLAKEVGAPYLTARWIGGLLTNFDEIKKNFKRLTGLQDEQEKGTLSRYTKKEQLLISRKLGKFTEVGGGAATLEKVPDAIFIVDAVSEKTAIKEAMKVGLKLLGFSDTNADPNWFDYPIPANDDGIKSIKLVSETVIRAYGKGKEEAGKVAAAEASAAAKALADKEKGKTSDTIPDEKLEKAVAAETEVLEEVVEKKIVQDFERKVT